MRGHLTYINSSTLLIATNDTSSYLLTMDLKIYNNDDFSLQRVQWIRQPE